MRTLPSFLAVAALVLFTGLASAADTGSPPSGPPSGPGNGMPPGPPPEAITACKGKTEGSTVTFSGRHGESFTGTCQLTAGVLAARPAGGGGPKPLQR